MPETLGAVLNVPAMRLPHRTFWVVAAWVLVAASFLVGGLWIWWAIWGNHPPVGNPAPDRWLNLVLGLAAVATVAGVVGGAYLAAQYGRRASISIAATIVPLEVGGVVVAARPVVKAVGLFRVRFHGPHGALVRVRELRLVDPSELPTGMKEDRYWEAVGVFGDQFAEGGEELTTTVMFRLPSIPHQVVGWIVAVGIEAPTRWVPRSSGAWGDKIFVPRPKVQP
jgi:hypothetical protein